MPTTRRRRTGALAPTTAVATALATAVAGSALAAVTVLSPAQAAAPGSPPVTVDDKIRIYAGSGRPIDPIANDTDPDGDDLATCRLGRVPRNLFVSQFDGELFIATRPGAGGRTFTFTYYACDFETLVPGTVTVKVLETPDIRVTKSEVRGVLRVRNPAKVAIRFLYGSFANEEPDGSVRVPKRSSRNVRVHRRTIDWLALDRRGSVLDQGTVRRIRLPRGGRQQATTGRVAAGPLKAWRAAGD